ncbi:hypothetical protein [Catenovulum sediminis]|uniref:Calx-beta domain-containing protein n=1 Tax=Catenovulum sediminis TaxID=1740262 RepID=A0ABV1RJD6_9ALTE|nr:hypothetical protein [Catenovulum sediminis]
MKTIISLQIKLLMIVLCSSLFSVRAEVPEPQITLYGQVFNRYHGIETRLNSGQLQWQIKALDGSAKVLTYSTSLNAIGDGQFDYRLDIPQRLLEQALTPSLITETVEQRAIAVGEESQNYSHNLIAIDNVRAYVVNANQNQLNLSQAKRSQHIQIDLYVSKPPVDTDGDGLPDSWELGYFGDTTSAIADNDEDEDGLTNLEEYQLSSDPRAETGDNRIPTLIRGQVTLSEQGFSLLQPQVLDSDTWDWNIDVTFNQIDENLQLSYLAGGSSDLSSGTVLAAGDVVKLSDLLYGHVVVKHLVTSIDAQDLSPDVYAIQILVDDKEHQAVVMDINVDIMRLTDNQATTLQMWLDASVDQTLFDSYDNPDAESTSDSAEEWFGRAGRGSEIDLLHHIDNTGWQWADVVTAQDGPNGEKSIKLDGNHYLESWAEEETDDAIPFHFNNELGYFAVFKTNSESTQILTHDTQAEIVLTAHDDPYYPNRLRFSREGYQSVYGTRTVSKDWNVAALFIDDQSTSLELNVKNSGVNHATQQQSADGDPSNINWGTSRTIGGKMIGSANDDNYQMQDPFTGSLGEVVMLNCGDCKSEKWRVYAYLYSKWFDRIVVDHSQTTYAVNARSAVANFIGAPSDADEEYESLDEAIYYLGDRLGTFVSDGIQNYQNQYGQDKSYIFIGGAAHNKFVGGSQDDILVAGRGSDWLTGLAGSDLFVVTNGTSVVDFDISEDVLDLTLLFDVVDPDIPLSKYIKLETDTFDTYISVDANGDGSGYHDANIVLSNISIRNNEINKLWARGVLQTGVVRPDIKLYFNPSAIGALEEKSNESIEFELTTNGVPMPTGMSVPISITGSAEFGADFLLEVAHYDPNNAVEKNQATSDYKWHPLTNNGIPLDVAENDTVVKLRITPKKDNISELPENLTIQLMPLDVYAIGEKDSISFSVSDGLPDVSITATNTSLIEGLNKASQVTLTRDGSLDVSLKVNLEIVGSAENGSDYGFISKEITFAKGQSQTSFEILPYADTLDESTEFVEIVVSVSDSYQIASSSSVKIGIFESDAIVDTDNDGMDDMWEIENGLNFNKDDQFADADGDGLINIKEYELALNPNSIDTDNDGIPDKQDRSPDDATDATKITSVGVQSVFAKAEKVITMPSDQFVLQLQTQASLDSGAVASGLDGIGVRIHFNSQIVKFNEFKQIYATDFVYQSATVIQDFSDYDNNPLTDSYIELRWSKTTADWQLPDNKLAAVSFTTLTSPTSSGVISFSASQLSVGYDFVTQPTILMASVQNRLDLNNDGQTSSDQDALAVVRYMSGLRGLKVNQDISETGFDTQLSEMMPYFDLDANGEINALTDGLLLSRCMAGYEGSALIDGIIDSESGRQLPDVILQYCRQFTE